MLIIDCTAALEGAPLTPRVRRLLTLRSEQLGGHIEETVRFIVVEPGDALGNVEEALAFPITVEGEPCFDLVADHDGLFELIFTWSDDGPADVVLVPDGHGIDPALIDLCRRHATAATAR